MNQITFGTGNPNKLEEIESILGGPVVGYTNDDLAIIKKLPDGDLPEIQSMSIETVAREKARAVYEALGKTVIVEDTGFFIDGLNGFPGPFVKYTLDQIGNEGILKLMSGVSDRTARAITGVCSYDGKDFVLGMGEVIGTISEEVRKGEGKVFGYDPIFIPKGSDKTFAEMLKEEKNRISMRKMAIEDYFENYRKIYG